MSGGRKRNVRGPFRIASPVAGLDSSIDNRAVTRRVVVVEGSDRALAQALREAERDGARVVHGWRNDQVVVSAQEPARRG
jgi:hypothetical protein